MAKLNEFEIFQNRIVGAQVIWEFTKQFRTHHLENACPSLLIAMPVIPLCFNSRVIKSLSNRSFKEGSLLKAVDENKDLFSGLQERMEDMAQLTFDSIYLGSVTGLFNYDRENDCIIPKMKNLPFKVGKGLSSDYINIISTSKRVGAWFSQFNQTELTLYFNLHF